MDDIRTWTEHTTRCYIGVKRADGRWHRIFNHAHSWLTPEQAAYRIREIKRLRSACSEELPKMELKVIEETVYETITINSKTERREDEIVLEAHKPERQEA